MATYDQLMQAARRADAEGNESDARRLLQMAQNARNPQPQAEQSWGEWLGGNIFGNSEDGITNAGERLGSWLNRAGESMTFGLLGDEASAAATGMLPGRTYEDELARYRANEQDLGLAGQLSADLTGGLVGALATGGGLIPQGASLLGRMGIGAGVGAAGGAAQGFMEGEGGLGNRVENAATGGALGGALGFAAPALVAGARGLAGTARDMIGGGVDTVLGRASQGRADRAIARTMERAGMTQDDVARALTAAQDEGQGMYRVMDALGKPGQRRASGIVRGGEEGADELAQFLAQRQLDQTERVGGYIEDALGFGGRPAIAAGVAEDVLANPVRSAEQMRSALESSRGAIARTQYDAARSGAQPVDIRGVVAAIDDRLAPMRGVEIAGDSIDAAFQKYRNRLIQETADGAVELSDFGRVLGVKQDLQDEIGKAVRAGENNRVAQLSGLAKELDAALEASSEGYRLANDSYRTTARTLEALEAGGGMARGGRSIDNVQQFAAMTPDQQQAARIGYGDVRLSRAEGTGGETTNRMLPFNSTKAQQEMGAMALDPELWAARRARENAMWQTQNRALGGSMTADNLADIADNGFAADVMKSAGDILTGNFRGGVGNLSSAASKTFGGLNAPTRERIAAALMADDAAALGGAQQARIAMSNRQRLLEALLMSGSRGQISGVE